MKRYFVLGLFGSFIGFGMLWRLLSAAGSVGAHNIDVRSDVSRANEVSAAMSLTSNFAVPTPAAPNTSIVVTTLADDNTSNGNCTFREAITAANTNTAKDACPTGTAGLDSITFSAIGTIVLSSTLGDLPNINQDLNITGPGAASLTISGNHALSVLVVNTGVKVNLSSVTIANGYNSLGDGGAIGNNGSLTITNSIFSGNSAAYSGGAILNYGALTLLNSTFSGNSAGSTGIGNNGGAIYNRSTGSFTITNSIFSTNTLGSAYSSGGSISNQGILKITNSTFTGNSSVDNGDSGGGIYNEGSLAITNSTISDNRSETGAGIFINSGGVLTLTNSTISGNRANKAAGGLYNASGTATLNNVTIADDTADYDQNGSGNGGGVFNTGTVNVMNTLIGTNIDNTGSAPDCYGTLTSRDYNLIGNSTFCTITGTLNHLISNTNPLIGPLGNYGGATQTHALLSGSPAIDAGNPAASDGTGNHCMPTDQRGIARPSVARCDIGAFERQLQTYLPLVLKNF